MSLDPSNRHKSDPSQSPGASLATAEGMVKALDDLLKRFPNPHPDVAQCFDLRLPPPPKAGAVGPDEIQPRLDALSVRINALFHDNEASGRENEYLRKLVRDLMKRSDTPPKPDEPGQG